MKHPVLGCFFLLVSALAVSYPARAQYILAGQTAGVTYVDIVPAKRISATLTGDHVQTDSLDLDKDGRFDIQFKVELSTYLYPFVRSSVLALHNDAALAEYITADYIKHYVGLDTIQQRLINDFPYLPIVPAWVDKTSVQYNIGRLTHKTGSPGGPQASGLWIDGKDGYVGVRLRATARGQWRYAWVRVQVLPIPDVRSADFSEVTLFIKGYGVSNSILASQPALATGWQLAPIPTSERLTVTAPAATTGQLVLRDVRGRICLATNFTGTQQQLDLSALAAGVYVLRITTATSSLVQRVVKR